MPRLQINCHLMRTAMCGILRRHRPRREQMPHSSTTCTWPYERPRHSTTSGMQRMQQHDAPKLLEPIAHHHGMCRAGTGPAHRRPSFALSSPRATRTAALAMRRRRSGPAALRPTELLASVLSDGANRACECPSCMLPCYLKL